MVGGLELRAYARHLAQWVGREWLGREWLGRTLQAEDTNDGLEVGGCWAMLSALTR